MPKFYYVDSKSMHGVEFFPRVPMNRLRNEDFIEKRVCVTLTLNGAICGMSRLKRIDDIIYVHRCECDDYIIPTEEQVPDIGFTGEIWLKKPVTMVLESIIIITGITLITDIEESRLKKYGGEAYKKAGRHKTFDIYTYRYLNKISKRIFFGVYHPDFIREKKVKLTKAKIIHYIPKTERHNAPNIFSLYRTHIVYPEDFNNYEEYLSDERTKVQDIDIVDHSINKRCTNNGTSNIEEEGV